MTTTKTRHASSEIVFKPRQEMTTPIVTRAKPIIVSRIISSSSR
nr:hypothetical protein [Dendronalium sp. ChiSLP03b]MDZ8209297.1 hypothetical protein [Dendronalium sp. ChiSLP03b]